VGLDNVGFIEAQYEVLGMMQKEMPVPAADNFEGALI
jgi:hypothetical protein